MFAEDYENSFHKQCLIDDKKVSLINSTYWETIEEHIRPRMISNGTKRIIDRHKIASTLELCVCCIAPLEHDDKETKNDINARLAFYIGLNIIGNWSPDKITTLFVSDQFHREHMAWLREVNANRRELSIFSNAATWYLVELLCIERSSKK